MLSMQEFGIKRENEERRDGGCAVVFDPETQKYAVGRHNVRGTFTLFGGGFDEKEDPKEGVFREVREESGLHDFAFVEKLDEVKCHYHNENKNVNRVAYATCFLAILKSDDLKETKLEEHENFTLVWEKGENILKNWEERNENQDYSHWIHFFNKAQKRLKELGYLK
jgi:ADP-ribose pyrophosphatase YjhB (NUDIX family)